MRERVWLLEYFCLHFSLICAPMPCVNYALPGFVMNYVPGVAKEKLISQVRCRIPIVIPKIIRYI